MFDPQSTTVQEPPEKVPSPPQVCVPAATDPAEQEKSQVNPVLPEQGFASSLFELPMVRPAVHSFGSQRAESVASAV